MPCRERQIASSVALVVALAQPMGCSGLLDLDRYSVDTSPAPVSKCQTNAQCVDLAAYVTIDAGLAPDEQPATIRTPSICQKPEGRCVALYSNDCTTVTGNYLDDNAVVIGSLFAIQGATASQNIPRQQSAQLAVEEVNATGGIPSNSVGISRPLVMLSCNTTQNLMRAANHLVSEVRVPAIIGPNTSQDTLDVSNTVSVKAGTVVMSPTAVAASIASLIDDDLTWLMIPSDDQRGPLMIQQINSLETSLKALRSTPNVKLAIIFRNDALGVGTRDSLDGLIMNGKSLSDSANAGSASGFVRIEPYAPDLTDVGSIVTKVTAFAPDIVVLAGTSETVTNIMIPMEQQWSAGDNRPYYLLIDPSKGPELLTAVSGNEDLRLRVRGTGTTPGPDSVTVNNSFKIAYISRYGESPTASGTGPSYDAAYSIAYALAATKDLPVSGANIALGLRKLASGTLTIATGQQDLLKAFQVLAVGQNIAGIGTYCPLDWDANGLVRGGTIEIWCIGQTKSGSPTFGSSGLTFDIKTQQISGTYIDCG